MRREPPDGGESDDSVHGSDMNGCRSLVLWQRHSTTPLGPSLRRATRGWLRVPRTTPHEARTQSTEPERWRSASCTTRRGARSLGRGQHHWLRCGCRRGTRRHAGIGYELVLNPVLAEQLVEVFSLPALAVEYISPASAVLSPAPVVESIAPAQAVISSPAPILVSCSCAYCGVSCSRASGVRIAGASCGVHCTRTSGFISCAS